MQMKISISKKKVIAIMLVAVFILSSIILRTKIAYAYPDTWDRYSYASGGINMEIYSDADIKKTMDTYNTVNGIVPDSGEDPHGTNADHYPYTTWTIKDAKISKWYKSGYGPFLDYVGKMSESEMEDKAAQFNQSNDTYNNADYAYIASTQENLADAKSVAMIHYTVNKLEPLLLNKDTNKLSSAVMGELDDNNIKNAIVVGGGQRLDAMFGIGDSYNILRIGGIERNKTYEYLDECEDNKSELYNVADMPQVDVDGIVCDIKDTKYIRDADIDYIKTELIGNHFETAANFILNSVKEIGAESNISSGEYSVFIGGKNSSSDIYPRFLIVYYLYNNDGYPYGVYQYIGPNYEYDNDPGGHVDHPPTAIIDAPDEIIAGERVKIDGSDSYAYGEGDGHNGDPDDKIPDDEERSIEDYRWTADPEQYIHSASYDSNVSNFRAWFEWTNEMREQGIKEYEINIDLRVTDNAGARDSTDHEIIVKPPIPTASLNITGTMKENRLITVSAEGSEGTEYYPITNYIWSITPINGGDASSIKYDGTLNGSVTKDMIIKTAGTYKVTVTVVNDVGYTATASQNIVVRPDEKPVWTFAGVPKQLRDPSTGYATFTWKDGSKSIDGDTISKRVWLMAYDSNNNGSYQDETWYVYDNGAWRACGTFDQAKNINIDTINDGNKTQMEYKTRNIGKYEFEVIIRESFGEPTLPQFITKDDYRVTSSFMDPEGN